MVTNTPEKKAYSDVEGQFKVWSWNMLETGPWRAEREGELHFPLF
jgi:hypothetical protein